MYHGLTPVYNSWLSHSYGLSQYELQTDLIEILDEALLLKKKNK